MSADAQPRLERSLNLRNLVLFDLVAVIGVTWVAVAAKAGPSSLTLWLLAALLFFIPQGLAFIQLSTSYPDEGGIYAWTKREFREGHGFLCGWPTSWGGARWRWMGARRGRSCSPLDGSAGLFLFLLGLVFYWRRRQAERVRGLALPAKRRDPPFLRGDLPLELHHALGISSQFQAQFDDRSYILKINSVCRRDPTALIFSGCAIETQTNQGQ